MVWFCTEGVSDIGHNIYQQRASFIIFAMQNSIFEYNVTVKDCRCKTLQNINGRLILANPIVYMTECFRYKWFTHLYNLIRNAIDSWSFIIH
jgi:hypothetical protein